MVKVPDTYLKGRKPEDFCAMHVRGDSMYPDFRDGDIVPVLKQNTRNYSGEIGVISYGDDEMTIKRINYVQSEDWMELVSLKPVSPAQTDRGHRPGKMPYYRYPAPTDTRVLNIKITPTGCNRRALESAFYPLILQPKMFYNKNKHIRRMFPQNV